MDTSQTLILVNVLISLIHLFDTFIQKLKRSSCLGSTLEMKDSSDKNDIENPKPVIKKEDLIKQLEEFSKLKIDNNLNNDKNLDPINKV